MYAKRRRGMIRQDGPSTSPHISSTYSGKTDALLERVAWLAKQRADRSAQSGEVRILMREGKPVGDTAVRDRPGEATAQ